jgi:DNA polymerase III delta prime subunit
MIRLTLLAAGLGLFPVTVFSDAAAALSCPEALEQIATLNTFQPVYKLSGADKRHYIDARDRPAEISRLQKIAAASCSTEPKTRAGQQAEADRLHVALSPDCAVARDELAGMERRNSHQPSDTLDEKRRLVAARCPRVETTDRWLVQWNGRSTLEPLN